MRGARTEYSLVASIKRKVVFESRPRPLVKAAAAAAAAAAEVPPSS
jgi:hypothetical protein